MKPPVLFFVIAVQLLAFVLVAHSLRDQLDAANDDKARLEAKLDEATCAKWEFGLGGFGPTAVCAERRP
jgi:hypothetical protein